MPRRLLTLSHSYVVALNRRLAVEMARAGGGEWSVTAAAPRFFHGDLRPIPLERDQAGGGGLELVELDAHLTRFPHFFFYGPGLRRVAGQRWDVLHCWEEPYVLAAAEVAAFAGSGARLVFSTYQNLPKRYPQPFRSLERRALSRAAGWVGGGRTVVEALADRPGYRERPWAQIPMGVDLDAFQPDPRARAAVLERLGWSGGGPPVFGFMGRFVPEKGCALFMEALDGLSGDWRALVVGDGPLRAELEKWANRRPERVRVLPGVRHDEVPAHLNAMDVVCVPSQTTPRWKEQFGRALVEAFACGRAVLASDSGEIPHTAGPAAELLPESNAGAWTAAMERLRDDPDRRRRLGELGVERARRHFAWPVVARQHLEFFEKLLG
ncbi:MAG TPA: glycosyltransferase family 4 protein [Myxococcales bacterium]|nr:glycosyltransferase family 4 protein [Myxococcales bacterium]